MTIEEAVERLKVIRKYGREVRVETRKTQLAVLEGFLPREQGEILARLAEIETGKEVKQC